MAHRDVPHDRTDHGTPWWVLSAWASLGLLVAGGLAGAAGIG